jgi:hypothetical protein
VLRQHQQQAQEKNMPWACMRSCICACTGTTTVLHTTMPHATRAANTSMPHITPTSEVSSPVGKLRGVRDCQVLLRATYVRKTWKRSNTLAAEPRSPLHTVCYCQGADACRLHSLAKPLHMRKTAAAVLPHTTQNPSRSQPRCGCCKSLLMGTPGLVLMQ